MAAFVRTTVVDASPGADVVKQAVLDVDTDLTGIVAAYNAHDIATTNVHGSTGAATGTGAMVRATSPALVTPSLGVASATKITMAAGTTLIAPIILTAGTNLTTPLAGAVEFDGTDYFLTV